MIVSALLHKNPNGLLANTFHAPASLPSSRLQRQGHPFLSHLAHCPQHVGGWCDRPTRKTRFTHCSPFPSSTVPGRGHSGSQSPSLCYLQLIIQIRHPDHTSFLRDNTHQSSLRCRLEPQILFLGDKQHSPKWIPYLVTGHTMNSVPFVVLKCLQN